MLGLEEKVKGTKVKITKREGKKRNKKGDDLGGYLLEMNLEGKKGKRFIFFHFIAQKVKEKKRRFA